jgi:hypothetical protein
MSMNSAVLIPGPNVDHDGSTLAFDELSGPLPNAASIRHPSRDRALTEIIEPAQRLAIACAVMDVPSPIRAESMRRIRARTVDKDEKSL